jgi:hypothetical protein
VTGCRKRLCAAGISRRSGGSAAAGTRHDEVGPGDSWPVFRLLLLGVDDP